MKTLNLKIALLLCLNSFILLSCRELNSNQDANDSSHIDREVDECPCSLIINQSKDEPLRLPLDIEYIADNGDRVTFIATDNPDIYRAKLTRYGRETITVPVYYDSRYSISGILNKITPNTSKYLIHVQDDRVVVGQSGLLGAGGDCPQHGGLCPNGTKNQPCTHKCTCKKSVDIVMPPLQYGHSDRYHPVHVEGLRYGNSGSNFLQSPQVENLGNQLVHGLSELFSSRRNKREQELWAEQKAKMEEAEDRSRERFIAQMRESGRQQRYELEKLSRETGALVEKMRATTEEDKKKWEEKLAEEARQKLKNEAFHKQLDRINRDELFPDNSNLFIPSYCRYALSVCEDGLEYAIEEVKLLKNGDALPDKTKDIMISSFTDMQERHKKMFSQYLNLKNEIDPRYYSCVMGPVHLSPQELKESKEIAENCMHSIENVKQKYIEVLRACKENPIDFGYEEFNWKDPNFQEQERKNQEAKVIDKWNNLLNQKSLLEKEYFGVFDDLKNSSSDEAKQKIKLAKEKFEDISASVADFFEYTQYKFVDTLPLYDLSKIVAKNTFRHSWEETEKIKSEFTEKFIETARDFTKPIEKITETIKFIPRIGDKVVDYLERMEKYSQNFQKLSLKEKMQHIGAALLDSLGDRVTDELAKLLVGSVDQLLEKIGLSTNDLFKNLDASQYQLVGGHFLGDLGIKIDDFKKKYLGQDIDVSDYLVAINKKTGKIVFLDAHTMQLVQETDIHV